MGQSIYEKIESKGQAQVNKLLETAKLQAKKIEQELIDKANQDAKIRIDNAQKAANKEILYKERLLDLEMRQALLISKQNIISSIFDNVLTKLNKLEGKDLLSYVEKLIKSETVVGNEILRTNKNDYKKYLKALSTNKKADLVELDLLNKVLKTNFKISDKPVDIKNGFLLEGKHFDLNFSLNQIIENLRNENEKGIAKELFE